MINIIKYFVFAKFFVCVYSIFTGIIPLTAASTSHRAHTRRRRNPDAPPNAHAGDRQARHRGAGRRSRRPPTAPHSRCLPASESRHEYLLPRTLSAHRLHTGKRAHFSV